MIFQPCYHRGVLMVLYNIITQQSEVLAWTDGYVNEFLSVSGVWCGRLLPALLGVQRQRPVLDGRWVHRRGQSHHLDRGWLQLHLQAASQVSLSLICHHCRKKTGSSSWQFNLNMSLCFLAACLLVSISAVMLGKPKKVRSLRWCTASLTAQTNRWVLHPPQIACAGRKTGDSMISYQVNTGLVLQI